MMFSNPLLAFKNLYHSLKKGGQMFFCTWSGIRENDFGIPLITLSNYLNISAPNFDQPGPISLSEPGDKSLLKNSGLLIQGLLKK